ncbi:hypothetical protein CAOG_07259 [Capsaspora owczarzaki ATCC 30864]|uniref:Cytochrome b561 domain-containing protein n=1 Tax=Capsaspora owczarzaki (strain ATCC 30864) TaxID=595528 RepID=A0A0D2X589_CAPO3|nr:hypothetical protein CAOG_07259 [Capsaspora owczarzaki ATCC 30864]KJE97389.1 hypothetical protein CAOG_007259 [Capsaspora owczarzaki ATCC 30864]|eukprot:XP_004343118.1 hypothetical protein CAOG_07259 [Capsaspora owczarzaki ATCC 30864]
MYESIVRPAASWLSGAAAVLALAFGLISTHVMLAMIVSYVYVVSPFTGGQGDGGVSMDHDNPLFLNTHPLCMVLAFCFFMPEAALVYRWLPAERPTKKYVHAALHSAALISSSIGWYVKWYDDEYTTGHVHFGRMHSHFGLIALILFYGQYLAGFGMYLFPGAPLDDRPLYSPYHKFVGVLTISLGAIAAGTGALYIQAAYAENVAINDDNQYYTIWLGLIAAFTAVAVAIGVLLNNKPVKRDLLLNN